MYHTKESFQYFVDPYPFFIAFSIQFGKESDRFSMKCFGMLFLHISNTASISFLLDGIYILLNFPFMKPHKFSIAFKSGEFPDQAVFIIDLLECHSFTNEPL
ncbi:MAG: hypothetical protein MHMPM18_001922 [Marteilia pararefringens]